MKICRVVLSDIDLVVELFDQYRQFYSRASDKKAAKIFLEERLNKNESIIFAAFAEEQMIGFIQLYPSFSSLSMLPLWILNDLYVLPSYRRQSVARHLLNHARDFAKSSGANVITLKTAKTNSQAQALYLALGWIRDDNFLNFHLKL